MEVVMTMLRNALLCEIGRFCGVKYEPQVEKPAKEFIPNLPVTKDMYILSNPKKYILSGKAIFIVTNEKTGTRIKYKALKWYNNSWKIGLMVEDYLHRYCESFEFLGMIYDGQFRVTEDSRFNEMSSIIIEFSRFWDNLSKHKIPEHIKIYHEGKCGCCGRPLTGPKSMVTGVGPVCVKKINRW
jgi:hypothetical protein